MKRDTPVHRRRPDALHCHVAATGPTKVGLRGAVHHPPLPLGPLGQKFALPGHTHTETQLILDFIRSAMVRRPRTT